MGAIEKAGLVPFEKMWDIRDLEPCMETVKLGKSGLEVSRLCLGGMSFGDPSRGNYPWTLPYDESKSLIRRAFDSGINFIDTANSYRIDNDAYGKSLYEKSFIDDKLVIETASLMAQKYGVSPAEIALAWIIGRHKNSVPILGVTKEQQLDQCINSSKLNLSEEDLLTLESNYVPHSTAGH